VTMMLYEGPVVGGDLIWPRVGSVVSVLNTNTSLLGLYLDDTSSKYEPAPRI
jgi:hypothetical protein